MFVLLFVQIGFGLFLTDCFRGVETSSFWSISCWSSKWRGSCLQEDPPQSWGCAREECTDKLLGEYFLWHKILLSNKAMILLSNKWGHDSAFQCFVILKFSQILLFILNFREWASQLTSWGLWFESGKHWLKPMWMSRPLIITPSGCSALHSPSGVQTRSREHAMPKAVRSVRFTFFSLIYVFNWWCTSCVC